MMYVFVGLFCFIFGILLTEQDNIKRHFRQKNEKKRYNKLLNGVAKRVVQINNWDDVWKYRKYPLLVDGKIIGVQLFNFWHCNDEHKALENSEGKHLGYLVNQYEGSYKRGYHWSLAITKRPSLNGKVVNPSAVIEVY